MAPTRLGVREDLATAIGAELVDLGRLEEGDHLPERVVGVGDEHGGHELTELLPDDAVLVGDARDDLREDVQPLARWVSSAPRSADAHATGADW